MYSLPHKPSDQHTVAGRENRSQLFSRCQQKAAFVCFMMQSSKWFDRLESIEVFWKRHLTILMALGFLAPMKVSEKDHTCWSIGSVGHLHGHLQRDLVADAPQKLTGDGKSCRLHETGGGYSVSLGYVGLLEQELSPYSLTPFGLQFGEDEGMGEEPSRLMCWCPLDHHEKVKY